MHRKLKKKDSFILYVCVRVHACVRECVCMYVCVYVRMHVKWMPTEDPLGSRVAGDVYPAWVLGS